MKRRRARAHWPSGSKSIVCASWNSSGVAAPAPGKALLACKLLASELLETLAGVLVRAERLIVRVLRIGRDLLGDGADLSLQRLVVLGSPKQRFDPGLVGAVGRALCSNSSSPRRM